MLRQLRKKKIAKRILWVLAALIIPAFVLWGAGSATRSRSKGPSYVGKIYGKKITFEKFARSYEACYHQLVLFSGGDPEVLKNMSQSTNINQMAWTRLILLKEAKRQHMRVSDKEVVNAIASSPLFRRKEAFDKRLYGHILKYSLQSTPRKFEEEMRENLLIGRLRDKVLKDVAVSEEGVSEEYKKENEKIKLSFILIDPQDFIKNIQLNAEELKTFYQTNIEELRKGDEVDIRYFHIESENTELLNKVTEEIHSNKNFEKIAEENNLEIKGTGFFGMEEEIPTIGWSYELARAAFALEEGMTSFPIFTPKGYYVINIKEKRSGYIPSLEEAETELNKRLIRIKSGALAKASASNIYKDIEERMGQGRSFEKTAKKLNLRLEKTEPFSRREYIKGIGQAELLKKRAFTLSKGEVNPPIQCEKGFVIFKVDELMPIDEEKYEEEKEKVKERLLARRKMETFNKWFEEVSKNARLEIDLNILPP